MDVANTYEAVNLLKRSCLLFYGQPINTQRHLDLIFLFPSLIEMSLASFMSTPITNF